MEDLPADFEPNLNKMSDLWNTISGLFFHNPTEQERAELADRIRKKATEALDIVRWKNKQPEAIPTNTTQVPVQLPIQTPTITKQENTIEFPKMPQFDWTGFMKLLASPYATPAGIQYILSAGFNLYKSMLDDYNAKVNTYKAVASAENPIVTKAMQLIPSMYSNLNELLKIIANPAAPPEVIYQAAVDYAKLKNEIERFKRIAIPTENVSIQQTPANNLGTQPTSANNLVKQLMPTIYLLYKERLNQ
jgi:hypothetical protein